MRNRDHASPFVLDTTDDLVIEKWGTVRIVLLDPDAHDEEIIFDGALADATTMLTPDTYPGVTLSNGKRLQVDVIIG